ncbi:endolytic transglycosylase MltG, partial [Candidatus Saccharibacteria bacterium CG_4_10_14_0_2_um_filter_52_9]
MPRYSVSARPYGVPRRIWWLLAALITLAVVGVLVARHIYIEGLKPVSNNQTTKIFTVKKGSTLKQIASNLEDDHLIRSAWAFQLYVHRKEVADKLQAGTYAFSPNLGTKAIVTIMSRGRVATQLVTILPGSRIDEVRADLINYGFSPDAVDRALDPGQYADLPALAFKPADVNTLEGLLWPDSWYKDASSSPADIIRQSLQATSQHLTPDVQAAFAAQNLTVYRGLTLASIVLQEVNKPTDQAMAAQVFLSRFKAGLPLGSDVTVKYGAIAAGRAPTDLSYDSAYNTHLRPGLPPSPISTVNVNSLNAAAHPAGTDWLFFVTGDDGT